MSKPWGGIGAWAAEAEREEAEEREAAAAAAQVVNQSFPSLKEAVSSKPKKKKMSLSEFTRSTSVASGSVGGIGEYKGLTQEEMLRLPTGPKERSAEEMQYSRYGGGFSSYGRSGQPQGRNRDRDDGDGSWGGGRRSYGGFDDERRGPPSRASDFDQPSRADEADNWASLKKSVPAFDSGRQNRYGALDAGMGGVSRADENDNWGSGKKSFPSRSSTFGSGFRDSGDSDRWNRGGFRDNERERPRLVLNPPKGNAGVNSAVNEPPKTNKPNPFGAARPREEVLAQKGLDWKKLDSDIDAKKTSRPTSSHSSRPSSAQSSRSEGQGMQGIENVLKPRPKVNPFGNAKPREVLLEERGKDWRKMDLDLEHRAVERLESEEEKMLKEEIDNLKKVLNDESKSKEVKNLIQETAGDQPTLQEIIITKERELESLIRDLDDKVRFGQKAVVERPSSGAGRAAILERPPSQSGKESRSSELMDRPHSHGKGDGWLRPADDRRGFQGGQHGGFLGNRDYERSRSRDRW